MTWWESFGGGFAIAYRGFEGDRRGWSRWGGLGSSWAFRHVFGSCSEAGWVGSTVVRWTLMWKTIEGVWVGVERWVVLMGPWVGLGDGGGC